MKFIVAAIALAGIASAINAPRTAGQDICCAANADRAIAGLPPFKWTPELDYIATKHSEYMLSVDEISHVERAGTATYDLGGRMKTVSFGFATAGENVANGYADLWGTEKAWMGSEGHRANILSTKFTVCGGGVADPGRYFTADFAAPADVYDDTKYYTLMCANGVSMGAYISSPEPSYVPIPEPSYVPIPEPSSVPIPEPSYVPIPEPSYVPIPEPSSVPIPEPSYVPIPEPSYVPIPEPSSVPIPEPSYVPIPEPSSIVEPVPSSEDAVINTLPAEEVNAASLVKETSAVAAPVSASSAPVSAPVPTTPITGKCKRVPKGSIAAGKCKLCKKCGANSSPFRR
ncbi:hypothetical protein COEREDRAFT_81490 [Coemansia reversa NRRL 1564]|uniref:SCP domain-containing protein n=1 Tax=Coemansia reversa (strain ATCC 12441 / NRRL 1564) TaxID=763665 RepID=A0A2G5BAK2_COERN|nr:hypothetical protein COEREDRAFT_81490 [Coemansia reversa NRRL 1564]|eukprot:PIA16039.1 hypothetical protein COEREDRAFT_81490 [Coemansia reversa NRRL 1564]